MFFDQNNDWNLMEAVHVLTLRACAPENVFILAAQSGYLTRVGGNHELSRLSDFIFEDDFYFIENLPDDLKSVQPQLIQLIQLAYKNKIRQADLRVKKL